MSEAVGELLSYHTAAGPAANQAMQHSSVDSGGPASAPPAAVKLSKSKLHQLQAQLTHCNRLLSTTSSPSFTSSASASASTTLVLSLTTFLSNLFTLHTELVPHTSVPFDLVATRLLPGVYDLLSSCLQQPALVSSAALPLLLQCVALFPLPVSSTDRLRLLCDVSGESVQRLVLHIASETLDGVCMSATTVTARLSSLSSSSLLSFILYVRQLLQTTEGTGSAVLILLLHCSHQLWAASGYAVATDELSICLRRSPSLSELPTVTVQLLAHSDRVAAHLALCEHKQWVDWSLFTLVLPSVYQSTGTLSSDIQRQLLRLLAFFHSSTSTTWTAVYDWLDRVHRTTTEQSTLSTLFVTLSTTGLLDAAPSTGLCLQQLLCFIPLYAPQKDEVSYYLSSLLAYFAPTITLPTLLYHLLSHITLFLSTAPSIHAAAAATAAVASAVSVTSGAFVVSVRSVSECWAHSLTCDASVPALKWQGVEETQEKRIREHTRHVLNELRQLAVGGTMR